MRSLFGVTGCHVISIVNTSSVFSFFFFFSFRCYFLNYNLVCTMEDLNLVSVTPKDVLSFKLHKNSSPKVVCERVAICTAVAIGVIGLVTLLAIWYPYRFLKLPTHLPTK